VRSQYRRNAFDLTLSQAVIENHFANGLREVEARIERLLDASSRYGILI
jgi:hypothetical protein